jgi:hypothetical protein
MVVQVRRRRARERPLAFVDWKTAAGSCCGRSILPALSTGRFTKTPTATAAPPLRMTSAADWNLN